MSSRPLLKPQVVLDNALLTADKFSIPTNVNMISICSYTISWTGTPTGSFVVEVSNDFIPNPPGVIPKDPQSGTWVALPLSSPITVAGAAGSAFADIDIMGAAWIRLHYVFGSSTGHATATIAGKCA